MRNPGDQWLPGMDLDGTGYVNQYGLGRKVQSVGNLTSAVPLIL